MKAINKLLGATGVVAVAAFTNLPLAAQDEGSSTTVVVPGQPPPPQPPPVVVQQQPPPSPPPSSTVIVNPPAEPPQPSSSDTPRMDVPDSYVWDGYENVGVVGEHVYYLGPDNMWMPADKEVLKHFKHWEKHHKDWREHAVRNEKYYRTKHEEDHD